MNSTCLLKSNPRQTFSHETREYWLQFGDIVIAIDGKSVKDKRDFANKLRERVNNENNASKTVSNRLNILQAYAIVSTAAYRLISKFCASNGRSRCHPKAYLTSLSVSVDKLFARLQFLISQARAHSKMQIEIG